MIRLPMIAAFTLGVMPFPALAQDTISADRSAAYDSCMKTAMTSRDMGGCGGAWVKAADTELNSLWKRLLPALPKKAAAELRASQRRWIAYKDGSCAVYYEGFGSAGRSISAPRCRAKIIEQRIDTLNDLICPEEGYVGCVLIGDASERDISPHP